MAYYVISYDLHNQRNYKPVWDLLESWGAVRLLESLWVLTITGTANTLRDALKGVMDSDDSCAVVELKPGSYWACQRSRDAGVAWLRTNILP